jgi:hypothetical protein
MKFIENKTKNRNLEAGRESVRPADSQEEKFTPSLAVLVDYLIDHPWKALAEFLTIAIVFALIIYGIPALAQAFK